ncbi:MAG TPA: PilZ domain-containing protein [Vicinamibacterales bacterium]|nr:PilZ domain-containing protein [Vicinamibacterales bacterium]
MVLVLTDPSPEDVDALAKKRARRLRASDAGVERQARLLPGGDANILNMSNTGLLVENKTRLPIGSTVNVRVEGSAVMGVEGHIVRSRVSAIHRDGTLSYETAIEFEQPRPIDGSETEPPPKPAARGRAASSEDDVYVIDTSNDW